MVTIKRINIGSAFRVGALVSLLVSTVSGLFILLMQQLFLSALIGVFAVNSPAIPSTMGELNLMSGASLAFLCVFYVFAVIMSAIFGGIGAAVGAFAYNISAGWVGGLEVELETGEKSKRRTVEPL